VLQIKVQAAAQLADKGVVLVLVEELADLGLGPVNMVDVVVGVIGTRRRARLRHNTPLSKKHRRRGSARQSRRLLLLEVERAEHFRLDVADDLDGLLVDLLLDLLKEGVDVFLDLGLDQARDLDAQEFLGLGQVLELALGRLGGGGLAF
jgi:hypothetical protein